MKTAIKYLGPYVAGSGRIAGRRFMVVYYSDGSKGTTLYSRYLYQKIYGFIDKSLVVDHIDEDSKNDNINNFQILSREDNARKSAVRREKQIFTFNCPVCGLLATKELRNVIHNNLKQGKAGPFCGRKCARKFQVAGMAKQAAAVDLKSTVSRDIGVRVPLPAPKEYMGSNKHEDMNRIMAYINEYGFEKTFQTDDYEDIDNVTFHRLRNGYLKARQRLTNYIISHSSIGKEDADKF